MESFIQWNSWWSQQYRQLIEPGGRYSTTKAALNLLLRRNGMNIVETGTVRKADDWTGAGMATVLLGSFCHHNERKLWTVDINPDSIALSRQLTTAFESTITYVAGDSIAFLRDFDREIDLLYLDSVDCPADDSDPAWLRRSQEHQYCELVAAWDKLHAGSIILLDDNDFANGGKCRLSNQMLEESGWTCVLAEKQVLWIWDSRQPFPERCPEL